MDPRIETVIADFSSEIKKLGIEITTIVLFGSQSDGTATSESDVDLAIISPSFEGMSSLKRRKLSMQLYQQLWGVGAPVDILVETPDSFNKNKTNPHLIYREIARTGRYSMKNRSY